MISDIKKIFKDCIINKCLVNEKQNFKIISDGFVSQNMLIISHLIIKTIFNLDENLA